MVRPAQTLEPGKNVWITYDPPGKSEVVPVETLPRPVAEAEAYGAHWVITLHESHQKGIEQGDAEALASWKRIVRVLQFFNEHQEWSGWEPTAALAVVADFENDDSFLAGEFLNLAPRRHLAYRIVRKADAVEASFAEQKGILYIDTAPPEGDLKDKLLSFAKDGGLLILPTAVDGPLRRPNEAATMSCSVTESSDGKRAVIHIVDYAGARRGNDTVTLGFSRPYKMAKVFTLDGVTEVKPVKTRLGVEMPVPRFSIYVTVAMGS
ncbi:MAG: hypothetical protein GY953_48170 [bacterium]|nr:hypothetical protein [bacterium]